LAHPYSDGVVVVVLSLRFVISTAVESVDDMVGGEGGVRREDADLEVAELVGLKLAVLEVDQKCIDGLDTVFDFDEILREEVANAGEVSFSHSGPEMLLEIYYFDGGGGWARGLGEGRCGEGQQEREEATHAAMVASDAPPGGCLVGGRGFGANFADGGVDDGVQELSVIGLGLGFDVLARAFAGCGVVGKSQAARLCGDRGELLDDVEEGRFVLAGELPAIGDGASKNLLGGPIVRSGGIGRGSDGSRRFWLLRGSGESSGYGEAECDFVG
jgi:hypothetical protein